MDTIFALASARGKAGVAVVRLSGPASHDVVSALCGKLPELRRATLRRLRWDGVDLDDAIVLTFAAGASFTGEVSAEFHLHGSRATIAATLRALSSQPGCRLADAGEFTRRALENGMLDLAQVEGLADLIDAETEAQRRQALRVLSGAVGQRVAGWRRDLVRAAALLEASIDFAEEDVPVDVGPEVVELMDGLMAAFDFEIAGSHVAERVRDGFEVAIVGAPNVGKSTLLNALARREAAITSEVAGTTRDVIEVRMEIGGLPVTLLDTAGLRETDDPIERIGIDRAVSRASAADMRIFLEGEEPLHHELSPQAGDLKVRSKADLPGNHPVTGLSVSGLSGLGVDALVAAVEKELQCRYVGIGTVSRERHRVAIEQARVKMVAAKLEVAFGRVELAAEAVREVITVLEEMVGVVNAEQLLDEIFSSFCIGK